MTYVSPLIGQKLGQYEVQELLFPGSLVDHYKGYQTSLKRHVLVQTLAHDLLADSEQRQALIYGAELIAQFEHPNIVPILDQGIHDEIPYIVMRWMSGGSLREKLREGALSFQQAISVVRQIASALDYVHSRGRVHGDPAGVNIVFDAWGNAYLADFLLQGFFVHKPMGVMGVPLYMAPERWHEEPATPATDQYALAALAYEIITGHVLFESENVVGLLFKHTQETPPLPQIHRPDIPEAVNDVLLRALAKAPEDRYPTVADLAREFEKAMNTAPRHLFISYSRRNKTYAEQLKAYLTNNNLPVWIDHQIEHGDQWFNQIHEAIKSCGAFLVIMSPDGEQSEWVQKEILLAKRYKKPIFPLLLEGEEFPLLIDIQFADVRGGQMPTVDFHRRVSQAVYGRV